ncbi:flagellar basal body P-ring formation protein FlgA [Paracoccus sediminis]|uniref:Flagella basal body P-ring formation protein FlgA n=1 Tax=Paracoccus sediminis TaxID=1214787 RepID=A0A238W4M3_9RHOB|nr:flagellar basal body P-ring formation chaperone FlgA [Paracoccus sediminis]TBN51554.1 flagellar basal body P-ring formation protein FlgA [Paracoccus sediminis]SNR41274.1 flagella basal body P-ring formation protein FlgA [Paracoccus sediminis]
MRWLVLVLVLSPWPAQAAVLAAARTLPAGTIITAADLRAVDGDRPGLSDPSEAIGLQTRITIREGRPLQAALLQAPRLIARNQIHPLTFQRGPLRIVIQVRTLSDGAAGDVIRVMNLESRTSISAVIQPDGSLLATN